jgi:hypothetical protein
MGVSKIIVFFLLAGIGLLSKQSIPRKPVVFNYLGGCIG